MKDLTVDDPGRGPFNENFSSIKCIGKGAFGFVNLAERKSNKEEVTFICNLSLFLSLCVCVCVCVGYKHVENVVPLA